MSNYIVSKRLQSALTAAYNEAESIFADFLTIEGDVLPFLKVHSVRNGNDAKKYIPYMGFYVSRERLMEIRNEHVKGFRSRMVWATKHVHEYELKQIEEEFDERYKGMGTTKDEARKRIAFVREENKAFDEYSKELQEIYDELSKINSSDATREQKAMARKEARRKEKEVEKKYRKHLVRRCFDAEAFDFNFYLGISPCSDRETFEKYGNMLRKAYDHLNGDLSSVDSFEKAEKLSTELFDGFATRDLTVCLLFLADMLEKRTVTDDGNGLRYFQN